MEKPVSPERRRFLAATAASLLPMGGALAQTAPAAGASAANIAVIGEPGSIDPMLTLADLVNQIDQHFFETLYYTDPLFHIGPVLASALPNISADGKIYTIPLRENVPFHDGTVMTAGDVVASLQRWLGLSARAAAAKPFVVSVTAPDAKTVVITLNAPYSPLMTLAVDLQWRLGDHAEAACGVDGSAEGVRRHRAVQNAGARAGPLHPGGEIRQIFLATGQAERVFGRAQSADRRVAFHSRA